MRKTETYTVQKGDRPNRDVGKTFLLTEMPARKAEKFAVRVMQALGSSGVEINKEFAGLGMIGVFLMAYQTLMKADFILLEPLMDEMLVECVQVLVDGNARKLMSPDYDDFDEVETIFAVRKKVIELHAGFTFADVLSKLKASAPPRSRKKPSRSSGMPTSPT